MEKMPEADNINLEVFEHSKLVAKEKIDRILDKDFKNYAIRVMSLAEFEEIISVGHIPNYKEVYMPNHSYSAESDRQHTDIDEAIHSRPTQNEKTYGHYKEKKPKENKEFVSFEAYLHHNQTAAVKNYEYARKLFEFMGQRFTEPRPVVDWEKLVRHQTQETSDTVETYDIALVLDIDIVNKPNPKDSFHLPWGFVYTGENTKDDQIGNTILGVVSLKNNTELENRLIQISSSANTSACPVFTSQGEVLFP